MRPRVALLTTLAVVASSVLLLIWISDAPVSQRHAADSFGRHDVAVLALRDHVVPFQKWGTKMFTLPALERHYVEARYFTLSSQDAPLDDAVEALRELLARHRQVDLFLLLHSNRVIDSVESIEPELRRGLRLVYDTGCGDAAQAERWRSLGADVHVGHPGARSVSPVFYFFFLRRWTAGFTVEQSVRDSNRKAHARLSATGLVSLGTLDGVSLAADSRAIVSGDDSIHMGTPSLTVLGVAE